MKVVADYLELLAQWHLIKNRNLTPYNVVAGSHTEIWWQCCVANDHEWKATPNRRVSMNTDCPYCAGQKVVSSNCLANTYPELAKQWHPTKNGNLTSYMITAGSGKKVWWKCSVGDDHEWEATPNTRTSMNTKCPCCSSQKVVLSNCLATTHPEIAAQWHPIKNGDLNPYDVVAGSRKNIWWKCSISSDHEWQSVVYNRTHGSRCLCCIGQKVVLSNCLVTTHLELASQWHPTKNGNLTPYMVTAGSNKEIWWQCEKGHEWKAKVNDRKINGCQICSESKGEKAVAKILTTLYLRFKRQWRFKSCRNKLSLPFDFVVKSKNGIKVIEYQGEQHYVPTAFGSLKIDPEKNLEQIKKHDAIKEQWCKERNIPLLAIPYWDFNNMEKIISEFLV
jgi:hypothetical protein